MAKAKNQDTEVSTRVQLLNKLYNIMLAVPALEKDGYNEHHKYKYTSEKTIKENIRNALVQEKVLFLCDVDSFQTILVGEKQKLNVLTLMKYRFIDVDTGEEISGTFMGHGEDQGDKGTYKAITGAIKYILTTQFLIPTGDDPELIERKKEVNKNIANEEEKISEEQMKRLRAAWDKFAVVGGIAEENSFKILIATASKKYGVLGLQDLTAKNAEEFIGIINSKLS